MQNRPNIFVVCGRNKKRSRTAENIFKNDSRFNIRSAGISPNSEKKITEKDLIWADRVFVMEKNHKSKIVEIYGYLELPAFENLNIPDVYEFMDEELVDLLTDNINSSLKLNFDI